MGFCVFNNVAVGVAEALSAGDIDRVAVLDFDVHHGNGTVDIFQDDERVLVCSSFQHPFYPGRYFDIDRPNIVNTPLPEGTVMAAMTPKCGTQPSCSKNLYLIPSDISWAPCAQSSRVTLRPPRVSPSNWLSDQE